MTRYNQHFTSEEVATVLRMRAEGATYREIGYRLGRTHASVKGFVARNITVPLLYEWPLPRRAA